MGLPMTDYCAMESLCTLRPRFFSAHAGDEERYNQLPNLQTSKLHVLPTTPVGITEYTITFAGGGEAALDIKMPHEPLPPQDVEINWTERPDVEPLSYSRAVENYKAEYRRRYAHFLETGDH
jgi:hypothetical protein